MSRARRLLPPLVPGLVLFVHAALMYRAALRHTAGVVSYPVDDAFIHLALAKHIAFDGIYGVSASAFTAASSSVGWPLLLAAAMKVCGAHSWLPLALNAIFGLALVYVIDAAARRLAPELGVIARVLIGLAVVVLTPIPTVVVLGMEHTAHIVATVAFIAAGAKWLAADVEGDRWRSRPVIDLALLAAAVTLWRYEGAFPIVLVSALAALRRRVRSGALICAAGALPGVAFGLYAKAHGSFFLPVPVVLKGRHIEWSKLGDLLGVDLMDRFGTEAAILVVALACAGLALILIRRAGFWSPLALALTVTLGVFVLHLELASIGWFYRYESYLLATGIAFAAIALATLTPPAPDALALAKKEPAKAALPVVIVFLLAMPLRARAVHANDDTPSACGNIFEQQMQSARFLARFGHDKVAINDIGAVAWLGDEPFVDLVGLASLDVARAKDLKLDQTLPVADIERLTAGVKVAIIYDDWFQDGVPSRWLRVGRWRIRNNKSCASPVVSIYATDPSSYPEVITELRRFAPELPDDVEQLGMYLDRASDPERIRPGDHVVITSSARALEGTRFVDHEGSILIQGVGRVVARGVHPDVLRSRLLRALAHSDARLGATDLRSATVERITRVATGGPRVHVVGRVPRAVETPALTLDAALAAAGGAPESSQGAWVWREQPSGFVKVARAELAGGALADGDIVVVP